MRSEASWRAGKTNALRVRCDGEAQGVLDLALRHLVVAGEARAGSAGRRRRRSSSPAGAAGSSCRSKIAPLPARHFEPRFSRREQLVEPARAALDEQQVTVAAALDLRSRRDRIRALVGLARVLERDPRLLRVLGHDLERDADPAAAEVRVHGVVETDRADHRVRAGPRRRSVDALVPRAGGREDHAARDRGGGEHPRILARAYAPTRHRRSRLHRVDRGPAAASPAATTSPCSTRSTRATAPPCPRARRSSRPTCSTPTRSRACSTAGFDGVVHFAALSLVAESVEFPERY